MIAKEGAELGIMDDAGQSEKVEEGAALFQI
jgi:hypothetical protein